VTEIPMKKTKEKD